MPNVLVLDAGGEGFRGFVIDFDTMAISESFINKPFDNPGDLFAWIKSIADRIKLIGVAIGIAGEVKDGVLIKSPNMKWLEGTNIVGGIFQFTGLISIVINDMHATGLGMAVLLSDLKRLIALTWSSGIGGRFVIRDSKGKIHILGFEWGHMTINHPSIFRCGCDSLGHVEAFAGGRLLKERVINHTKECGIVIPDGTHPCRFLDERYLADEAWARAIYKPVLDAMGIFVANLVSMFGPPLTIVFKGTVAINTQNFSMPRIREIARDHLMNPDWVSEENLQFVQSPEPEKDALYGALEYFLTALKQYSSL